MLPWLNPTMTVRRKGHRPEATIVKAVIQYGPRNLSKIAKEINVPVETVRYKLKRQLSSLGFRVMAEPDYYKMGLRLFQSSMQFTKERSSVAESILQFLSKKGYLIRAVRLFPKGVYSVEFALPLRTREICYSVLKHLVDLKVISRFDFEEINFISEYSTNPDFFDIRRGVWNVDWEQIKAMKAEPFPQKIAKESDVDKYDIMLLEEFQKDATQHVSDIAERMHVATPVLGYHYRTHLQKGGLVLSYLTRWSPSIASNRRKGEHVITTRLEFRDVKGNQVERLHEVVSKIPFIWSELATKRSYIAYLLSPSRQLVNMLRYLEEEISDITPDISFSDSADISHIAIPKELYGERGWTYNELQVKQELENIASKK
jgi:DNA-binding Lrp family transcriptional regulator